MGFDEVLGQKHVVRLLKGALSEKRVAHAYLFAGPGGVGKRFVAKMLARALNCAGGDSTDSCGSCSACDRIARRAYPDVAWIRPEGRSRTIGIDEVREMCRMLAYRPFEGGWKVCVIEEADCIHIAAANALLKTLEEPTSRTVIILTSEHPDRLPLTIVSRCQAVRFSAVPLDEMEGFIKQRLDVDPARVGLLAALSSGSIRRAELLAAEGVEQERDTVLGWMREAAGGVSGAMGAAEEATKRLEELRKKMRESREKKGNGEDADQKREDKRKRDDEFGDELHSFDRRLDVILYWLRDIMVLKVDAEHRSIINADRREELLKRAVRMDAEKLESLIELVEEIRRLLRMNVNPRLALGVLFLGLKGCPELAE